MEVVQCFLGHLGKFSNVGQTPESTVLWSKHSGWSGRLPFYAETSIAFPQFAFREKPGQSSSNAFSFLRADDPFFLRLPGGTLRRGMWEEMNSSRQSTISFASFFGVAIADRNIPISPLFTNMTNGKEQREEGHTLRTQKKWQGGRFWEL